MSFNPHANEAGEKRPNIVDHYDDDDDDGGDYQVRKRSKTTCVDDS